MSISTTIVPNDFKKGDPAEIFWKYFQNKWFSWSYKTTNLTEKWRNCWVFWRKSRYFDWFKYGFSITPTEFITYFQNISAGLPFLKSLFGRLQLRPHFLLNFLVHKIKEWEFQNIFSCSVLSTLFIFCISSCRHCHLCSFGEV